MSGVSIPNLPPAISVSGSEEIEIVQNGTSRRATVSQVFTSAVTSVSFGTTGFTPSSPTAGSIVVSGTLNVANGGTGGTNATDARTNLSAAKSGVNSDITQIAGLSDGAVSSPAVTFLSQPNTGIYRSGAAMSFAILGTAEATVTASGFNLAIGNAYSINGTSVLNATTLGSGVTASSLTSVGTLTSGALGSGFTTVAVGQGGTGITTATANGVVYGNGTSAFGVTAAGTTGQVLVGNTGGPPSWASLPSAGVTSFSAGTTGLTPSTGTTGAVTLAGTLGVANGGTGTSTAFTTGSIVFAGASGVYSQDNANLFWDDTNNRLGIGTASPNAVLTINAADPRISFFPSDSTYSVYRSGTSMFLSSSGSTTVLSVSGPTTFSVNGSERARITTNGNMGVGTTAPDTYGRFAVVAGAGQNCLYAEGVTNGLAGDFRNTGANSYGVRIVAGQNGLYALSVADKSSNNLFYVDGGGNVGIGGVTSPNYKLHVNGRIASTNATAGLGYGTGAGGTITQATSRTTGVTLNTVTGSITLVSAAGTATWQSFTVTNSTVGVNDVIKVVQRSGTDLYMIHVTNVAAGSFQITFATTGGTTTEQPVFNFAVIKGATT